jgi:AcrR family transcriptional regulator
MTEVAAARANVDERILTTALELLHQRGPSAVSIESVSAISGVAKTTIYRRYENRGELLAAAVRSAAKAAVIPTDLSSEDTIRWVLRHARNTIDYVVGRGSVAAVIMDEDPQFSTILLDMIRTTTRPLREELRRRRDAGELRADLDVELAMSALLGVVIAEVIRKHQTDDEWVEAVFRLLWPAFAA